jgi:two-component system, NtrC family, nitrogen regulation sensor histidine kinase NtrY
MTLFLIWMGILSFVLVVYCIFLWRKNRFGSRFKVKLTILFLLFVLIPVIPLTLFVANLMTQSANVLLLPGIGETLETSLSTIRVQLEEKGKQFISQYRDSNEWTETLLRKEGLLSISILDLQNGSLKLRHCVRLPECTIAGVGQPPPELLADMDSTGYSSTMHVFDRQPIVTVCKRQNPLVYVSVFYPVPDYILQSKERITRTLDVYNTLNLLKETIIQKNMIWAFSVLLILGLAVLSVQVSKKLSRGISEPIDQLVQGMRQIAAGDFRVRVHSQAKDELRFLIDSFNRMVGDLYQAQEKLIRAETIAAQQEVARRISHEMKNSLTPMAINLRRIRRLADSRSVDSEMSGLIRTIEEEVNSLQRMSSEFAEFARLPQPELKSIQINEHVQFAIRMAESTYGQIHFRAELESGLPSIKADPDQIKRVLNNLFKNAAEASRENGTVEIFTRLQVSPLKAVVLEIQDHGHGMNEETLQKLSTPYFTTKRKGTGLGLAIVEKIVKDHRGEITVKSQQGKGTLITILFPLP